MRHAVLVGLSLALLGAILFLITNEKVSYAELEFTEYSKVLGANAGGIIPASCESTPPNAYNGDGDFSGCPTVYCPSNGSTITPAKGEVCPEAPPPPPPGAVDGACTAMGPNGNEPVYSCSAGTLGAWAQQSDGSYHWYCNGSNGGATSPLCYYVPPSGPTPVNGQCATMAFNCTLGTSANQWNNEYGTLYTWSCVGSNGGTTASCSETQEGFWADLTAGLPAYTSATATVPSTLSSYISNRGTIGTGVSFDNRISVGVGSDCANTYGGVSMRSAGVFGNCVVTDLSPTSMSGLSAGAGSWTTQTYTFPSAGTYYLQACADVSGSSGTGSVYEPYEDNNCSEVRQVTIVAPSPIAATNLRATSLAFSAGPYRQGTPMTLTGVVNNNGTANISTSFVDNFTYQWGGTTGTWQSFTGNTVTKTGGLTAGTSSSDVRTFTPGQTGTLYIQYCIDSTGIVAENNETSADNCRISASTTVSAALPTTNLRAVGLTLSAGPYVQGNTITLNGTVQNNSSSTTGVGFTDAVTYQWGGTTGTWQTFAGNTVTGAALAGGTSRNDGPLYLTPSQPGTLYLRYCVDSTSVVSETNELATDNCYITPSGISVATSTVATNLRAVSLTLSAGPYKQGTPITLTGVVNNNGTANIGTSFVDNFTYQWGGTTGTWQTFAGNTVTKTGGLVAAANSNDAVSLTPAQTGTLYIQYCIDSTGIVAESNETVADNCRVLTSGVTVGPADGIDLLSLNLLPSTGTFTQGTPFNISASVRNGGTLPAGAFSDRFMYQWGGTTGTWQSFTGNTIAKTGLAAGVTSGDGPISFTPTQAGTLYLQHCVDSGAQVTETNESNCTITTSGGLTVQPGSFSCTGTGPVAPGSSSYDSEESSSLGSNTPWTYSATDTATKCQYRCNTGYLWNGTSCVAPIVTQFEVCLWNGTTASSCGSSQTVATNTPLALRWNSQNADSCTKTVGPADFTTGNAVSGTDSSVNASLVPNSSTVYTISCTQGGSAVSAASRSVTVNTNSAGPVLTTSKSTVRVGDSIVVSWDTNNGDESLCTLTGGNITSSVLTNGSGTVETGSASTVIDGRTTFTLTCGSRSDTKTVDIIPTEWES